MNPIILVGAGILLLGIGMGLGYWFAHAQRKREATRADDIQNELDDYRQHVTEHFGETAQHFHALGQQYQSLYKHMAQGADALCDATQSGALLGFATGNAPALMADDVGPENPPEVVRDYAPAEEFEPPTIEPEVELTVASEVAEDSSEIDATAAESDVEEVIVEDVIVEQAATPSPEEKERTVH